MGFLGDIGNAFIGHASGGYMGKDPTGINAARFIPGLGDKMAQDDANKLNQKEAQTNREFQERMSNTGYGRAMLDMKNSGLNPLLAYQQGGASTPTGATATASPATASGLGDFALKATTGVGNLQQKATALQQQQSLNESSIQLNASTAAKNVAQAENTLKQTEGLGKKASEGKLWDRFYKGINNVLDSSSKDAMRREKNEKPLIKVLDKDVKGSNMFNWLKKPSKD